MATFRNLTVGLVVFAAGFAACGGAETVERYCEGYEDLRISQEPGNWVPAFTPRSAVEIRVKYKIDTGAQILAYRVRQPEELSLTGYCSETPASDLELLPSRFLHVGWWPRTLSRENARSEQLESYEFYRCERQAFLALQAAEEYVDVFYWRVGFR
jgi:hypothetical protein